MSDDFPPCANCGFSPYVERTKQDGVNVVGVAHARGMKCRHHDFKASFRSTCKRVARRCAKRAWSVTCAGEKAEVE